MDKYINELIMGVRGLKGFMENGTPKYDRQGISFGVKFPDKEREVLWLIIQHKMIDESGILEDSLIVQS